MPSTTVENAVFHIDEEQEQLWGTRKQMYQEIKRRSELIGLASQNVLLVLRSKCDTEEVLHIRYSEVNSPINCFGNHLRRMAKAIESRDEQVYLDKCKDIKKTHDLLLTNLLAVLKRVAVSHDSIFSHFSLILEQVLKMSATIDRLAKQEGSRIDFASATTE